METGIPDIESFVAVRALGITYRLYPNCRNHLSLPTVVFYSAYNVDANRVEYIVGPNQVESFRQAAMQYAIAAGNFYGFLGNPPGYQLESALVGYFALKGDFRGAMKALGRSWLDALQSPEWWLLAIGSTAGALSKPRNAPIAAAPRTKPPPLPKRNPPPLPKGKARPPEPPAAKPPPPAAGRAQPNNAALARLKRTRVNVQNMNVKRTAHVLDRPTTFRHTITQKPHEISVLRIKKNGSMRLSQQGASGQYGEGVYAWSKNSSQVGKYIDIEVPAGTAVEMLQVNGQTFYRLVPASGNNLPVRVVGTNFTDKQLAPFRDLID